MSIKATGIRLSDTNKARMKALIPNKSFNDIVESLLDTAEKPTNVVSADVRKELCKKFEVQEDTPLETIVQQYFIDDTQKRLNAIKATKHGSMILEQYGVSEDVLSVIESKYIPVLKVSVDSGNKITMNSLHKAVELLALGLTVQHISLEKVFKEVTNG